MVKIKNNNRGSSFINLVWIAVFVFLLGLFLFLGYYLYMNLPRDSEQLNASFVQDNLNIIPSDTNFSEVNQFYPNIKFNHNNITYSLDPDCSTEKVDRMLKAFDEISTEVGVINFSQVDSNPDQGEINVSPETSNPTQTTQGFADIEISCSGSGVSSMNKDYFVAGEGGAKEVVLAGRYNVIKGGMILLYDDQKNSIKCDEPKVEIHELMHVLGFNHSTSEGSLMYPLLKSCNQRLDTSIINELKRLYSQDNLPDLYFENVSIIKKGRYVDFNLTIKNSGDVDAPDVSYSIFDDNESVESHDIGNISYGAGIVVQMENLKLIRLNPSEISFVIDSNNSIDELDKKNNIATVKLN